MVEWLSKIRLNIWFIVLASTLFGAFALYMSVGMLEGFEYDGAVDGNAIAVALVAVVSLILGYVLGLNQSIGQALLAPEPDPPAAPTMTEGNAIKMLQIVACGNCVDPRCEDGCKKV